MFQISLTYIGIGCFYCFLYYVCNSIYEYTYFLSFVRASSCCKPFAKVNFDIRIISCTELVNSLETFFYIQGKIIFSQNSGKNYLLITMIIFYSNCKIGEYKHKMKRQNIWSPGECNCASVRVCLRVCMCINTRDERLRANTHTIIFSKLIHGLMEKMKY